MSKQDGPWETVETRIIVKPKEKFYSVKLEMETSIMGYDSKNGFLALFAERGLEATNPPHSEPL